MADNIHLENFSDNELKQAAIYAKEHNISIESGFRGLLPSMLTRYIEITELLNAHLMRVVIDAPGFQPSKKEIIKIINGILPSLEEKDITLGIETHDRFLAEEFDALVSAVDSKYVVLILDAANSLANEELPLYVANTISHNTACFHAKDYTIRRRSIGMGLEIVGTIAGKGRLPIKEILEVLRDKSPYENNVILELWVDNCEITEEVLEREQEWVEKSIQYLKQTIKEPIK